MKEDVLWKMEKRREEEEAENYYIECAKSLLGGATEEDCGEDLLSHWEMSAPVAQLYKTYAG